MFCDSFHLIVCVFAMAINDRLLYEVNEKGERVVVKAMESTHTAYLRFTNRTTRPVDVWWRDFSGIKRLFIRLEVDAYYDINSFLTHPWEFTDAITNEHCMANNKVIFRAPKHVGVPNRTIRRSENRVTINRTNWNISIMLRTLRKSAMIALAALLPDPEAAKMLDMPVTLSKEVADLVYTMQHTPQVMRINLL